jgi:hypothetical protein
VDRSRCRVAAQDRSLHTGIATVHHKNVGLLGVDGEFLSTLQWVYLQCWYEFYILSIGTNPLGITSSFVHVGFGVYYLCRNLVLKARLPGKVHQAPRDKTLNTGTCQAMKWTWLQEAQRPTRENGKCWILRDKELHLNRREINVKGPHAVGGIL